MTLEMQYMKRGEACVGCIAFEGAMKHPSGNSRDRVGAVGFGGDTVRDLQHINRNEK